MCGSGTVRRVRVLTRLGVAVRCFALSVVALGLLAAGCGAGPGVPAAQPGPPADGGSYTDAGGVLAALGAGGQPCAGPSPVGSPSVAGATSILDCGIGVGSGGDTVLVVFDGHGDALAYARSVVSGWLGPAVAVVGVNWVVNTDPLFGQRVRAVLGGEVLASSPSPTS